MATIDWMALLLRQKLMLVDMNALEDVLENVDNVLGVVQMFHPV